MTEKILKIKKTPKAKPKAKKLGRCIDYDDTLIERLKNHDYAVAYLNAALDESLKGDEESQKVFLMALKNVAQAQGTMSDLARRSNLRRESLYRIFSEKGNPELYSFAALLHAMGFSLSVQ